MTAFKRYSRWILLAGDLVALLLFVYVGQRDHDVVNEASPLLGVLATSVYFAAPWIVVGLWLGAFPCEGEWTPRALFSCTLNAWLVTVLLGLLLRSFVLNRAVIPTAFVAAALGFGGLFLFAWRAAFVLVEQRMAKRL
jgi:hypothetical protein